MDTDSDMGLSQFIHSPSARPKATLAANGRATPSPAFADYPRLVIRNVHLPFDSDDPTLADPLYNVYCVGGRVDSVELATTNGNSHGSRHSTPPHHPEYQAKDRQHAHAELDAQGRGILLPASVRSFSPSPPFLALTSPPPARCDLPAVRIPQSLPRTHPSRQVFPARSVRRACNRVRNIKLVISFIFHHGIRMTRHTLQMSRAIPHLVPSAWMHIEWFPLASLGPYNALVDEREVDLHMLSRRAYPVVGY